MPAPKVAGIHTSQKLVDDGGMIESLDAVVYDVTEVEADGIVAEAEQLHSPAGKAANSDRFWYQDSDMEGHTVIPYARKRGCQASGLIWRFKTRNSNIEASTAQAGIRGLTTSLSQARHGFGIMLFVVQSKPG